MDEASRFKVVKLSKFLKDIEHAILAGYDENSKYQPMYLKMA